MITNGLCTLSEFKQHRGGAFNLDALDDAAIEWMIEGASRYLDEETGTNFYPLIDTLYLDYTGARGIKFPRHVLEIISVTNGDGVAVASTEYNLYPRNSYPKHEIRLTENTTTVWQTDSNSNTEGVIDVVAILGYHNDYGNGWKSITTVNEASGLNATDITFTVTSAALISEGYLLRIENELMLVTRVETNDVTVDARGGNGSTAATHANGTAVKLWKPMKTARNAALEIVTLMYGRRTGVNASTETILTPGGVVVTPRDVPRMARDFIMGFRGYL